jgi:hypothetical protein
VLDPLEDVMKKFAAVALFALFGGMVCDASTCVWDELREMMDSDEYKAIHDKTRPIIEEMVKVYQAGEVSPDHLKATQQVDEGIHRLNEILTSQTAYKDLDLDLSIELHFCPSMSEDAEMSEERKIGYEIIERWYALRASAYIKSLK